MFSVPYRIITRSERAVLRFKWREGQSMPLLANKHHCSVRTVRTAIENGFQDDLTEDHIHIQQWKADNVDNEDLVAGLDSISIADMQHDGPIVSNGQGEGDDDDHDGEVQNFNLLKFLEFVDLLQNIDMDSVEHLRRFKQLGIQSISDVKFLKEIKERGGAYVEDALIQQGFTQLECLKMFNAV